MSLFICAFQTVVAQKTIEHRDQLWMAYFNQTRLTDKSGVWVDLHLRLTGDFIKDPAVGIARVAYIYYLSSQVRLIAGYGYITQFSNVPGIPDIPEHRPWQQIQWLDKKNGFDLAQYFRIEERYRRNIVDGELTESYNFNWRFRYNFALTLPLKGKAVAPKIPFLFLNDEVHLNAGKNIVNNYFDQNRLFAGLGYQFTSGFNAQIGYLNVFQQLPSGNQFVNINAIRLFVYHNLDLRKQE